MRFSIKIISSLLLLFNTISIFGQHGHFDESTCLLIHNKEEIHHHSVSKSTKSYTNMSQSSTHVFSYLKEYGVDTWFINKTSNNSIKIQSYPANVGTNQQSYNTIGEARLNVIDPNGTYLAQNYANHRFNNSKQFVEEYFFEIPADSPNGEYKIQMGVYLNERGGYSMRALSDDTYLDIIEDTSLPTPITETHVFKETAGTEWEITQNESFSIGNEVHEWSLPLMKGENLVIDLYNVAPFVRNSDGNERWDSMDTMLYLLDADNNVVESNDDGGNNKNARIYYTVPSSGDYKIIASNYGKFDVGNGTWSVNLDNQDPAWNLGSTGITYYDLKIKSSSTLPFTTEDYTLTNPNAVKINAILLTADEDLVEMPVTIEHVQNLIADLNTEYNKLYDVSLWPGFELAVVTRFYDPNLAVTGNPHYVLDYIGNGFAAKQNHLNIIITEIDNNATGVVGTTNLYSNVTSATGASMVLDNESGNSGVLIHEMGHVIGMQHIAGTWPPRAHSLNLQNSATMGYITNYISNPEQSYMSTWNSYPVQYNPYISNYLTSQPSTLLTPSYGDLFSEAFRSWLITNQYIESSATGTGYEGNDNTTSASASWVNSETISVLNSVFSSVASSKNASNNHAAYAIQGNDNGELYYGFRNSDNTWTQSTYTTNTGRHRVEMNSSGDAIIIVEPWYQKEMIAIYKHHDQNDWSAPVTVSNSEQYSLRSNFEINESGNIALVWLDFDLSNEKSIMFREMVNDSWTPEVILSNSSRVKELPSVAYNDNGDVLVTWQEWDINDSGRFDVVGKFRNGTTQTWGDLETFSDGTNHAGFSQVAIDDSGDAIVYWRQATGTFLANEAENPVGELNLRYRNYDGSLENIVTVSLPSEDSFNATTESTEPRIVFDDGAAAVTWWGVNNNHNVVYASIMQDKTTWNTTALTGNGKSANLSSISIGNNGFIAVAWQRTDGLNYRIQSKFYDAQSSTWSSVMTMSDSGSDAIHSDIAADDNSSATASWVRWNVATSKYVPEIKQYTPIVITLLGDENMTLEVGGSYEESGATAINNSGVDVTDNIQISGEVNTAVVGSYKVSYDVTDADGKIGLTKIRTVNVVDTTIPVITLLGDSSVTHVIGTPYTDEGATATDNYDGDLTSSIVVNNPVDISTAGTYTVTYNVNDANDNAAEQVTRTVTVEQVCVSFESFETFPPTGWTLINSDVGINDIEQSDRWSDDGTYSLRFSAYYGSPTLNQFIISPQLVTTESDRYMKFVPRSIIKPEKYRVGWSSSGTDINNDFTWGEIQTVDYSYPIFEKDDLPVGTKYIAIEHIHNEGDYGGRMYVDSFCLPQLYLDQVGPTITSGSTGIDLAENSGAGQTVYTIEATDNDGGSISSYAIGGSDAPLLEVNNYTGVVSLTADPDYEIKASYSFTVTATDDSGNPSSATTVTFSITNVDEEGPTISSGSTGIDLAENSGAGQTVYTIEATDNDGGSVASYVIGGTDASLLEVNASTGVVTLTANPDYEIKASYSFTVTATDDSGNPSSATTVTFSITNVDEEGPTISSGSTGIDLAENSGAGQTVYTIEATDNDGGSISSYAIGGSDASLLEVNTSTGVVSLTADPDYETKTSYSFTVTATDDSGNPSSATTVTFSITNVDEEGPTISSGSTGIDLAENSGAGQTVYTIEATDNDGGSISSYAIGGSDASLLEVNTSTGVVSLTADPDYETKASYSFTVTAFDTVGNNTTQSVSFFIIDVDEIPPVLTEVTPIQTPSNNRTPSYVFTTSEEGDISSSLAFTSSAYATIGSDQTITFSELSDGTYTGVILTVTDASGNEGSLIIPEFIIDETASSGDNLDFASVVIYPNPAANKIFIDSGKSFDYELYNVLGQKIIFGKILEGGNEINTNKYSDGIYYIRFIKGNISFSKKIVINQ